MDSSRLQLEQKKKKLEEYRARKASAELSGLSIQPSPRVESSEKASQTEDASLSSPSSQPASPSMKDKKGGSPARRRAHSRSIHGHLQPQQQQHLSAEQQESMYERGDFKDFLDRSSKVMEIALNSRINADVLHDFDISDSEAALHTAAEGVKGNTLSFSGIRTHASVKGRPVMNIKASAYRPEQLVSAYGTVDAACTINHKMDDEPLGVVCVWSELLPTRPEFTFHASSPVLSADFHSLHPHLLVGTCYSGPLLIWDMRVRGRGAVKRSNPSAEGVHTHPVFSLSMTGNTDSSHTVLTGDLEGRLCCWRNSAERISSPSASWSMHTSAANVSGGTGRGFFQSRMTMPAAPRPPGEALGGADTLLGVPKTPGYLDGGAGDDDGAIPLALSCMGFGSAAYSTSCGSLFFGTTRGQLCRANWPIKDSDTFSWIPAHSAFLSALHCNPHPQHIFRDLLLTASFDWTVKLWAPPPATPADDPDVSSLALPPKPLLEFRGGDYDYVSDVKWSPTHPCVFALASSSGTLSVYDLSRSTSEPRGSCNVVSEAVSSEDSLSSSSSSSSSSSLSSASSSNRMPSSSKGTRKKAPLNKLEWSSDGSRIVCGDGQGVLYVVKVSSNELMTCSPEAATRVEDYLASRRNRLASDAAIWPLGDRDALAMGGSLDVDDL